MAFTVEDFCTARPYLYHLTAPPNIDGIRKDGVLLSAAEILRRSGRADQIRRRRIGSLTVRLQDRDVVLRDQDPLHEGNIAFTDGMSFADFLAFLNTHVFFWPGREDCPNAYGLRHFARYQAQNPVILRLRSDDVVRRNAAKQLLFSKYNSGAPRCSHGQHSPRGRSVFSSADSARFRIGDVAEVVFVGRVALPSTVELGGSPRGPWTRV